MIYGFAKNFLSDNRLKFDSKCFALIFHIMGFKQWPTTAYHPQTNGQTEIYQTDSRKMPNYVTENQSDWDVSLQPLTYMPTIYKYTW